MTSYIYNIYNYIYIYIYICVCVCVCVYISMLNRKGRKLKIGRKLFMVLTIKDGSPTYCFLSCKLKLTNFNIAWLHNYYHRRKQNLFLYFWDLL